MRLETLRAVVDCLIPPDDYAGAFDAGVCDFIVRLFETDLAEQREFFDAGLEAMGGNLYQQTTASGSPVVGVPGDPSFGTVEQGYLELSNVDPVKEITELITAQRSYEMNSKVIQAVDEMYSTVSRG